MAEQNKIRLSKVLRELNISIDRAVDFLSQNGHSVDKRPTTKISQEVYNVLLDGFQTDKSKKVASKELGEEKRKEKEALREQLVKEQEEAQRIKEEREKVVRAKANLSGPKTIGKIDLNPQKDKSESEKEEVAKAPEAPVKAVQETPKKEEPKTVEKKEEPKKVEAPAKTEKESSTVSNRPSFSKPKQVQKIDLNPKKSVPTPKPVVPAAPVAETKPEENSEPETKTLETKYQKLSGPKMTGQKIDLTQFNKAKKKKEDSKKESEADKRKKRKQEETTIIAQIRVGQTKRQVQATELQEEIVEEQIVADLSFAKRLYLKLSQRKKKCKNKCVKHLKNFKEKVVNRKVLNIVEIKEMFVD